MTNIGQAGDCGYNDLPAASLRPHQVTATMGESLDAGSAGGY